MSKSKKPRPESESHRRYVAKLNAHVDRVAQACAIGDACCRDIESLGREPSRPEAPEQPTAEGRLS